MLSVLLGAVPSAWTVAGLALAAPSAPAQRQAPILHRGPTVDPARGSPRLVPFRTGVSIAGGRSAITGSAPGHRPAIVLTGYWPPSNEAIRGFSQDPAQNPGGWIGEDWEQRGYDVHSFFPEFVPPSCLDCGQGRGDIEVDYQDTAADFWAIVDALDPIAVITFSRGYFDDSWELEMNQYNRSVWIDDYVSPFQPTPVPPDPTVPAGHLRLSALPVQSIVDALDGAGIGVSPSVCYSGNGGGFLSEFIAYLGVWYQSLHASPALDDWCVAAGHVHVGGQLAWSTARDAVYVTLRTVIGYVDQVRSSTTCQTDLGFAGPGAARLAMCGDALAYGSTADLLFAGAPAGSSAWLLVGPSFQPTPYLGGRIVPVPASHVFPFQADGSGNWLVPGIAGGGGPRSLYLQAVYLDARWSGGVGITNALRVDWLP